MNERRSVSAHYECFLDAGSAQSFPAMCTCTFAAGGLKRARGWERSCDTAHVHMEDSASQTVSVLLSQKNYIQVIVFYLLAQTKVIYLHIYKPINKVS